MPSEIFVNHIGFLCHASKKVIVKSDILLTSFEVQDMALVSVESFDTEENWATVYSGELQKIEKEDGQYYIGDFSEMITSGVYAVVVPKIKKRSFQFIIADGAFHFLPWLFADFLQNWSSSSESELKVRSTNDDGIRFDNGKYHPVKSGWYDAGDLRKWMTHTNLPAIGFYDLYEKLGLKRNYYHEKQLFDNDLLTISDEAVNLILEMQDPQTGHIFECLGAGGFGRADKNMSWWYENHSGCLADNSDNRFTDNTANSGDERFIRTDYNALIQYTSIYILLRSVKFYSERFPQREQQISEAVNKIWNNCIEKSLSDPLERKTAVISWKLMAAVQLFNAKIINEKLLFEVVEKLLNNYNEKISFWCNDNLLNDPYRGILHSAQPIIALIYFLKIEVSEKYEKRIIGVLQDCWKNYIEPLSEMTIFSYMPYGTYFKPASAEDKYSKFTKDLLYRKFMPNKSEQKINHGLNGHYTSWAHALALMGNLFGNKNMIDLSWNQIYRSFGFNDFGVSFISGVGYNNPMPHSRFLGTSIGGFMIGFIGNTDDNSYVDLKAKAQWNSTEYWNTPIGNCCMALAELLPKEILPESKLGKRVF